MKESHGDSDGEGSDGEGPGNGRQRPQQGLAQIMSKLRSTTKDATGDATGDAAVGEDCPFRAAFDAADSDGNEKLSFKEAKKGIKNADWLSDEEKEMALAFLKEEWRPRDAELTFEELVEEA